MSSAISIPCATSDDARGSAASLRFQPAALAEDLLGHRELADVVQPARQGDQLDVLVGQRKARRDRRRQVADAGEMAASNASRASTAVASAAAAWSRAARSARA